MDRTQDDFADPHDTEPADGHDLERDLAKVDVAARLFGEAAPTALDDRYRVEKQIGAGGMGKVYLAIDERLERRVAIKVLRLGGSERDKARLVREALMMARVPSVHVVPVHDVGRHGDQAFVAMEYVPGPTLREWWTEQNRSWREIVAMVVEAGRGLAAAHAAGVVHRDFKPDNVLIDGDGRARVVDFGLASVGAVEFDETVPTATLGQSLDGPQVTTLTRTGEVMGTPRYMAPEQFAAESAGEAADQFALCVTLYEGLYRQRPFEGAMVAQLAYAVCHGTPREPPPATRVPGWLWPVVRRGLSTDPEDRHPDVESLLRALQSDPGARRRRVAAAIGLLGLGGAATAAVFGLVWDGASPACELDADRFAGVWDDQVRAAVRGALEGSGRPHATETLARVEGLLDDYAGAWRTSWIDACQAASRQEHSQTVLDLRMACLQRRRAALAAATELLRDAPTPEVVDSAAEVASSLPLLDRCEDVDALRAGYPLPESPEDRAEAERLGTALAGVQARTDAGAFESAHEALAPVLRRARALGHPPLLAEALLLDGSLRRSTESEAAAEPVFREAAKVAATARADDLVSKAWLRLIAVAHERGHYDEARQLWGVAEVAIQRAGSPPDLAGWLANQKGITTRRTDDPKTARAHFESARTLWTEAHGSDSADVAATTMNIGSAAEDAGDMDDAAQHYGQALVIFERALGPQHPRLVPNLSALGNLARDRGRLDEARAHFERALAIDQDTHGPDHPEVAYDRMDLGSIAEAEGRYPDAMEHYRRALEIWTVALGPDHLNIASAETGIAGCLYEQDENDAARKHHLRALEIAESNLGAHHPKIARVLTNLGVIAEDEGNHSEAREFHRRALAISSDTLGPEHPQTIISIRNLAFIDAREKKWASAAARYREALEALLETFGRDHIDVAITHRELARIAAARGRKALARTHYEQALSIYEALGRSDDDDAKTIGRELTAL